MIFIEESEPGVWRVELRRAAKRNALGVEMYAALADVFDRIGADDGARVMVLSGEGPTFCAGNDLAEFATEWPQPAGGPVERFLLALTRVPVPVIAVVQGGAVGIGATLLLHCDLVVAGAEAFLQFPFVTLGLAPEGGSTLLLPERIGGARAMEVVLTGRRIAAAEALAIGLISRVSEAPLGAALELAREIAAKPAAAVRTAKRLMRKASWETLPARFSEEIAEINALIAAQRG